MLETSIECYIFLSSSQGPPGVAGLKGESGEAGPQVRYIKMLNKVKMYF